MPQNFINLFMNDYISILKKDLLKFIDKLIDTNIINSSFNKSSFSLDFMSKSKQGDVSTNLLIVLEKILINE